VFNANKTKRKEQPENPKKSKERKPKSWRVGKKNTNYLFMKKNLLKVSLIFAVAVMMTSCYTFTATVGNGPQTGVKVVAHNHYLIDGLAPISTAKTKELVGDAKDYSITVSHSFIDGFLAILTSGIYTPTTVTITK